MAIYLAGDYHFNHNQSFIYGARGYSSIQEHDQSLIDRHNNIVKPDDVVYILGDVGLGTDLEYLRHCIQSLNGHLYLVIGNHDTDKKLDFYRQNNLFEDIQFGYRIRHKKWEYILTHYPTIVNNKDDPKPVYNIHAHTHQTYPFGDYAKCFCVSVDAINIQPIEIEEVRSQFKEILLSLKNMV